MTAAFPAAPLDVRLELSLSGVSQGGTPAVDTYPSPYPPTYGTGGTAPVTVSTWTDVTAWAYQRDGTQAPVSITRGRPDETGQVQAAQCSFELNNRDGRFSPRNAMSPYYGTLGRNTPARWSVPARDTYLRLEGDANDRAYVNDTSQLHLTGSLEARIALKLTDWRACVLAAKIDGGECWRWLLNDDGTLTFGWWDASLDYRAITSTVPLPYSSGDMALRVTLDTTASLVGFYAGPGSTCDAAAPQLGELLQYGVASSVNAGNAPLVIGWSAGYPGQQMRGRVYEFRLLNGIGGPAVADGVFASAAPGTAPYTDVTGCEWQIAGGAEYSARSYRFHGELSALPGKWDVTGRDVSVPAQAGGLLRRLGQGDAPALSPMTRAVLAQAGDLAPVAFWPCEDLQGATLIGSSVGGPPVTFQGGTGDGEVTVTGPSLAADDSFLCANSLPTLNGSSWYGAVPVYSGASAWAVRFLCKLGTLPATAGEWSDLFRVATTGKCRSVELQIYNGGFFGLVGYGADGAQLFNSGPIEEFVGKASADARPLWWSLEAQPVTGGVRYSIVNLDPGAVEGTDWNTVVATSAGFGNVTAVAVNPDYFFTDTVMGAISVQSAWTSLFDLAQPLNAWQGETAADRFSRLCAENSLQCRILGSPDRSALMGAQPVDTLQDMLQECEDADRGQIYEPRTCLGLGYRTLASMLNQAPAVTADYAAAVLGGASGDGGDSGLDPTYDDQFTINDMTLTRGSGNVQGANFRYQLVDGSPMSISPPPAGVGDYASSDTVNVQSDGQLPDVAGWEVHIGTVDEARWPSIPWNLARPQVAGTDLYWQLLDADIGDFFLLSDLPQVQVYDPVRQLVFQSAETLGGFHYGITWNAVPESPYEVAVFDDAVYGIADTDGSALASGVTATATTLPVEVTGPSGVRWATTAEGAAVPFDIYAGGERMTVTDIEGTGAVQSLTVTRSVNGVVKSQPAGAAVSLWFAPYLSLV